MVKEYKVTVEKCVDCPAFRWLEWTHCWLDDRPAAAVIPPEVYYFETAADCPLPDKPDTEGSQG
jgi:hypothetical protein